MGIEASYRRVSPEEFQQLLQDPERLDAFYGHETENNDALFAFYRNLEAQGLYLEIGKDWQALHYLLTGKVEDSVTTVPPPLGNVVVGGTPTWDAAYGKARYLTPDEVRDVAAALTAIDEDDLREQFDVAAFLEEDIYPFGSWDEDCVDELLEVFEQVRDFFAQAARSGDVVLLEMN